MSDLPGARTHLANEVANVDAEHDAKLMKERSQATRGLSLWNRCNISRSER